MSEEARERISGDVVCVLGMHRSGTSVVAGALDRLGVDFGPREQLYPARADNPEGFFEHRAFVEMNEEILRRLGGSWHEPPVFPPGWERSSLLSDIRNLAARVIREDFSERPLWGWKDPRACLTLPFWRSLLPPTWYVLCVRSPLAVARSLELRDGFPIQKSGQLWLDYMISALIQTTDERRLILTYEDLIDSWDAELFRIFQFLGRQEEVSATAAEVIRPELQHHHVSMVDTLSERRLPIGTRMLYVGLVSTLIRPRVSPGTPIEMGTDMNVPTETTAEERTASREADHRRLLETCHRLLLVQESLRTEREGLNVEVETLRAEVMRHQAAASQLRDHPALRAYDFLRVNLLPHGSWRDAAYMRARRWLGTQHRENR